MASAPAVSFAGDIQVLCAPDLDVFLDGVFVGTSSAREEGLYLTDVAKGVHTIRVEKEGFVPRSFEVEVSALAMELEVEELLPKEQTLVESKAAGPAVAQATGTLVVVSAPQNCVVEIDGRVESKSTPHLIIPGLAAGEHTVSFRKPGYKEISGLVVVRPGEEVRIRGNLKAGKIESLHEGKGSLRIISKPRRCTVRFLGKTSEKTGLRLNLTHLPAGEHPLVVSMRGRKLSTKVLILNGMRTVVNVSFIKGDEPFVIAHESE